MSTNNLQRAAQQQQASAQPQQPQQPAIIDPKFVPLLQELAASPDDTNQQLVSLINFYGTKEDALKPLLKSLYNTVRFF